MDDKVILNNPGEGIEAGLAFVSEDRRGIGLLLDTSIELNIVITAMQIQRQFIKQYGPLSQQKTTGSGNMR
jgi:simple sugar transport system ATP-binding protein